MAKPKALSAMQAAKAAGVNVGSVRAWLLKEKTLAKLVERRDGRVLFSAAAIAELARIRERRYEKAGPALRKAWAARKAAGGTARAQAKQVPAVVRNAAAASARSASKSVSPASVAAPAPSGAVGDVVNTIEKAFGQLFGALRELLSRQAAELERARRPMKLVLEPEE